MLSSSTLSSSSSCSSSYFRFQRSRMLRLKCSFVEFRSLPCSTLRVHLVFLENKRTEVRGQKKSSSLRKCGKNGKRVCIIRTDEGVFKVCRIQWANYAFFYYTTEWHCTAASCQRESQRERERERSDSDLRRCTFVESAKICQIKVIHC